MSREARYQAIREVEKRGAVRVFDGRDRLTGLPVRIFRFRGAVRGDPSRIDHDHLPSVLAIEPCDGKTQLVTLAPMGFVTLHEATLTTLQVEAAADALAALHAAEIVHGGLGPRRLLVSHDDGLLLIDGGGVPWRRRDGSAPTMRGDVRALASMLLAKAPDLPTPYATVLEDAVEGIGADDGVALSVGMDAANFATSAGRARVVAPASNIGSVVKDLPPGGIYSSGEVRPRSFKAAPMPNDPTPRAGARRRRLPRPPFLLALLAVVVLAIAFVVRGRDAGVAAVDTAPAYVVEISVAPEQAPPLEIVVLEAPTASQFGAGSGLGRAPRRVLLDRPGRWILEGRFSDLVSEPVSFVVPGASRAVLRLPADAGAVLDAGDALP